MWSHMAVSSLRAVQSIFRDYPRSSISRAYYAVYSAVTHHLVGRKGVTFALGRRNPGHAQLPKLIENHLDRRAFSTEDRRRVKASVRRLYKARLEADYNRSAHPSASDARRLMFDARHVLVTLEIIGK